MKWHEVTSEYGDPYSECFALHLIPSFNPIQVHTHCEHTHPEQWAANAAAPGDQLGVRCLAQGSHLSRGIGGGESTGYLLHWQFLQEMRLSTSPYIRPRLPRTTHCEHTPGVWCSNSRPSDYETDTLPNCANDAGEVNKLLRSINVLHRSLSWVTIIGICKQNKAFDRHVVWTSSEGLVLVLKSWRAK